MESCAVPDLQVWLNEKKTMTQLLQQQLVRAQLRQKHQADKNRTERHFEVGDSVYLKLQPYVQTSIATRSSHKLSFRYFGPYKIIQKIGAVAYKLELPVNASVHPVFHVSQLKRAIPSSLQVSSDIPDPSVDALRFPLKILQRRLKHHGDTLIFEILVQWSSWPSSMATWELEDELKKLFPNAPVWGQAGSQRKGNVTVPEPRTTNQGYRQGDDPNKMKMIIEGRSSRRKQPNSRILGPEWVN